MKTSKRGISLIVLVITIIVMIILATAIILSLSGSDIRGKAEAAVSATDISSAKEVVSVASSEWELNYDKLSEDYDHFGKYATEKVEDAGITNIVVSKEGGINTIYKDKNGDTAIIPEGFVVSSAKGENTVENGLVIYEGTEAVTNDNVAVAQETRNQFVWVPVDNIDLFKRTTVFDGITIQEPEDSFSEPYKAINAANDPIGEFAEHSAMNESVEEYKGFYIGRYEAGKEGTATVVSKKKAKVWNGLTWGVSMTNIGNGGIVYRSRQMYKSSKAVVSTLCYGVQWDSALQFISTRGVADDEYAINSYGKGYYADGQPEDELSVQLSGSNDSYAFNNIYDMAGNVAEFNMEAYVSGTYCARAVRGGLVLQEGNDAPASDRAYDSATHEAGVYGFRVALYLK